VLVLVFRKNVLRWLAEDEAPRFSETDAAWIAFLADHPELR
jgi:hypothetical protein